MNKNKSASARHTFVQMLSVLTIFFIVAASAFAADGDLDQTFDGDGKVITGNFYEEGGRDVVVQPDGKIVVVGGRTSTFNVQNMAAVRYNASGSLDATFGTNGIYVLPTLIGNLVASAKAVAVDLQPDGKILLAGTGGTNNSSNQIFLIIRLNANGTLDTTFGSGGRVIRDIGGLNAYGQLSAMVFDAARSKIYVAGTTEIPDTNGALYGYTIMRFNLEGSPDATFNGTGTRTFPVADSRGLSTALTDIAVQPDGKIVATGGIQYLIPNTPSIESFGTARVNLDGSLDSTFGTNGIVITDFTYILSGTTTTLYHTAAASTVSILPSGKIFTAGVGGSGSGGMSRNFYFAAQLNADGALDSTFGTGGKVRAEGLAINDSVVAPNGKIIIVGTVSSFFAVGRLNASGLLDSTFGTSGITTTDFNLGNTFSGEPAFAAALQPDGKIVVSGGDKNFQTSGPGMDYSFVARYNGTAAPMSNPALKIADFDGDGKSDVSVFRPANGIWYLQNSTAGFSGAQFGAATDRIVPADYDGDGKTDLAVYRNGIWYVQRSQAGFTGISFGAADDVPVPADYDADGKADVAVFRPSNGTWYVQRSQLGFVGITFGQAGDRPVAADYDGDGKADVAVNRGGTWFIQRSTLGFTGVQFGDANDRLTPADYDGDGKADVAVFRPSNGTWYLQRSQLGFTGIAFGQNGDVPTPGDYDGDGRADVAVFRSGTWFLNRSTAGFTGVAFGAATDVPATAAFVR